MLKILLSLSKQKNYEIIGRWMLGITNDLHWVPYSNPLKDTKTDTFKENGTLMKDKLKSMFNDIHGVHIHQSSVLPS